MDTSRCETNLVSMLIREIRESMGKTNIRAIFRESMKELNRFTLFQNPVVVDYPDLKAQYESVIEFPCSLSEIKERLAGRQNSYYTHIGDVFRDLCLTASNALEFNKANDIILEQVRVYATALVEFVNEFIAKYNAHIPPSSQVKPFTAYDEMFRTIFKHFPPGRLPKCLTKRRTARVPYCDEVEQLLQILNMLPSRALTGCISALMLELETACDEAGKLVIDFAQMRPASYWWFDALVRETYDKELKAGRMKEVPEAVRQG